MIPDRGRLGAEDYLLLAAVLSLPWLFGGTEIWAYRAAAFPLVAGAAIALLKRGWAGWGLGHGDAAWLLPAWLLAAWALVQVVPLPGSVHALLSPRSHALWSDTLPDNTSPPDLRARAFEEEALARVPEAAGVPLPVEQQSLAVLAPVCRRGGLPLSVYPSGTWERLAWYVALLLAFLTVRTRVAHPLRRTAYRSALFVLFAALAIFGLVQAQTWNDHLYWVRPVGPGRMPFGPYINPVHFAGVMELAIPWLAAAAIARFMQKGRAVLREARGAMLCIGLGVCLMAGLAASSKMAAVLFAVSLSVVLVLAFRGWRTRLVVSASVTLLIALGAVLLSGTYLGERIDSYVDRLHSSVPLEGRWAAWEAGLQMAGDFPITGSGFGTFAEAFLGYTPPGAVRRWTRAHNDYLQVLVEGGTVAFALLVWLTVSYWRRVAGALRSAVSRRPLESLPRVGLAVGLVSLSVHAFVDFNHQVPANALLFVTLAAMALPHASPGGEPS